MKKKIKDLNFEEIISIHNLSFCNECPLKNNNGDCIRTGVTYNFSKEFLEKEIEIAGPTLSECIKEWEDKGFELKENTEHNLLFRHHKDDNVVEIFKRYLSYMYYPYFNDGTILSIPFELHDLIHKTLKALEVEKCEK